MMRTDEPFGMPMNAKRRRKFKSMTRPIGDAAHRLLLGPVAVRLAESSGWHEVQNSIAYYCCMVKDCDEVLRLTEPVPCPTHKHQMMEFLAKELPDERN